MLQLPPKIEEAISALQGLPGVGRRTALRYVLDMLRWNEKDTQQFLESIDHLRSLQNCEWCGCFTDLPESLGKKVCHLCSDDERKLQKSLCVVEQFTDFVAIENANFFKGHYHLLGGVLNPMLGVTSRNLRVDSLLERLAVGEYQKVILAINPSVEGDVTSAFLADLIKQRFSSVSVERIGLGMPIGGNFEYLDPLTISASFSNKVVL
ncbi:MAG: recombination mediator RecR [Bacteriovoracaceae bacterium]|nr:recombination mediator RecR [Bacteriovoracaceae bacterium]